MAVGESAQTLIPIFDLAERDRRWARLRQAMVAAGLDCLVGFPNSGHWDQFQAAVRYITQIGGNTTEAAVVFPLAGEVTAFVRGPNEVAWWGSQSAWIPDLRATGRSWAPPVIARLRELGLARARIGICGLSGSPRAPEGLVASGIVDALRAELPDARFSSATELVADVRAVKSPAELAFLREAVRVAEAAAATMVATARPGVPEREVFGAMLRTIVVEGGEIMAMLHWGAGPEPPWPHRLVTNRVLQAGDVINNEIEAKWSGYVGQVVQPMVLGEPPRELAAMYAASRATFEALCAAMRPGLPFAEIVALYQRLVREAGYAPGAALLHGRGLGEDRPLVMGHGTVGPALVLEEGNVFILKPACFPPGGDVVQAPSGQVIELAVRAGATVVVTRAGAVRLGQRPLAIATLPS
ncbi:MAG TPA: M24 family metallopeptidase [Chloroflexota bacterium]|nr:M24 family metallopeptidase [Chloroflexota bacterium]